MFHSLLRISAIFLAATTSLLFSEPLFETQEIFTSGPNDRPNYRIPSIISAPNGDILAIVERRNTGIGDVGDFDIVMRRSSDFGQTWTPIEVIFDDGISTSTDLTPLVAEVPDGNGGMKKRIFLFFLKNKKRFSYIYSDDSGYTWTFNGINPNPDLPANTPLPFVIHDQVVRNAEGVWDYYSQTTPNIAMDQPVTSGSQSAAWEHNWSQRYGIGPGNGAVQLKYNSNPGLNGRIIVPARHNARSSVRGSHSHVFFSDDYGQTWQLPESTVSSPNGNEGQLVEFMDGTLYHNMRNSNGTDSPDRSNRLVSFSYDGGNTWTFRERDDQLVSTMVHGSSELYVNPSNPDDPNNGLILFANPNNQHREQNHPYGRYRVSVRYSADNTVTWSEGKLVYPHPSSYTDLTILSDGTVGMIYERGAPGQNHYWSTLQFARFNLEWLMNPDAKPETVPVRLANIFSEGMVLQHGKPVNIWGYASAGDNVTVSILGQSASAVADEYGRWSATLPPLPITTTPTSLTVTGPGDGNILYVGNILVGDVWIASGQSNMNWRVRQLGNATAEIAAARHPLIREFKTPEKDTSIRYTPDDNLDGQWTRSSPSDLTTGGFSGTAFYFARELIKRNPGIPIGIINASVGGTIIEAWSTYDTAQDPNYSYIIDHYNRSVANPNVSNSNRDYPASLYNSMVAPLTVDNEFGKAYSIAGFIWYQGEHNASAMNATNTEQLLHQYSQLFPTLINGWREKFQNPEAPFYFVQLANYQTNGKWVPFRDLQMQALSLPNTGAVVTIDIGTDDDIHPKNKQDVGLRLALNAFHSYYGQNDVEYSGPIPSNVVSNNGIITISFTHADGIHIDSSKIRPDIPAFEIAGNDLQYHPAQFILNGSQIEVSSPNVSDPVHVRYAWNDTPSTPLYNSAKLPTPQFLASATSIPTIILLSSDDLLTYALTNNYTLTSDNTPSTQGNLSHLPQVLSNEDGSLSISFTPLRLGYTYEVQYSTDLQNWTTLESIQGSLFASPVQIDSPSDTAPRKFLRLKITPP